MTEPDGGHALGAPSFNLTVRPWIGVLRDDGAQDEVSLRQLFAQADDLRRVVGDLPTQEFALLQLLLAIAHGALDGPCDLDEWHDLWADKNCFDRWREIATRRLRRTVEVRPAERWDGPGRRYCRSRRRRPCGGRARCGSAEAIRSARTPRQGGPRLVAEHECSCARQ